MRKVTMQKLNSMDYQIRVDGKKAGIATRVRNGYEYRIPTNGCVAFGVSQEALKRIIVNNYDSINQYSI